MYRRVETEIWKQEATPAMRLLNDLLIMHDGFDDDGWLKACRKRMAETFPREDPFTILAPAGFDIDKVCHLMRPNGFERHSSKSEWVVELGMGCFVMLDVLFTSYFGLISSSVYHVYPSYLMVSSRVYSQVDPVTYLFSM